METMTEDERKALEEQEKNKKDPTVQELVDQINKLKLETVSKEEYEQILKTNSTLVKEIANNRPAPQGTPETNTREAKVKVIEGRYAKLGQGTSYDNVKILVDNYKEMKELGFDVSNVDESVVNKLSKIVEEAKGDSNMFNALMESRVKIK